MACQTGTSRTATRYTKETKRETSYRSLTVIPTALSRQDRATRPEPESLLLCLRQPLPLQTCTNNAGLRYYVRKGEANSFIE